MGDRECTKRCCFSIHGTDPLGPLGLTRAAASLPHATHDQFFKKHQWRISASDQMLTRAKGRPERRRHAACGAPS